MIECKSLKTHQTHPVISELLGSREVVTKCCNDTDGDAADSIVSHSIGLKCGMLAMPEMVLRLFSDRTRRNLEWGRMSESLSREKAQGCRK